MQYTKKKAGAALLAAILSLVATPLAAQYKKGDWPSPVHDDFHYGKLMIDRLEYASGDEDRVQWDVDAWYGGDYNRLWFKSEGEDAVDNGGETSNKLLFSRLIAPYWDFQAGLDYQKLYGGTQNPDRVSAVVGVQGLAPYWFETDAALLVSQDGDVSATLEGEYDWLLSQRLVLQGRLETLAAAQAVPEFAVSKGVNYVEGGFRLRYQIKREFAPYVGFSRHQKLGNAADVARAAGESKGDTAIILGVRMWF